MTNPRKLPIRLPTLRIADVAIKEQVNQGAYGGIKSYGGWIGAPGHWIVMRDIERLLRPAMRPR